MLNYIVEIQLDESPYWYYCNETNTPLLPTFYSTLAEGFRLNNYKNALDLVKKIEENYLMMAIKLLTNIVVMLLILLNLIQMKDMIKQVALKLKLEKLWKYQYV